MSEWLIHIIFSFLSTIGFGIVTNIPRRAFIASGFTGVCGWLVFWQLKTRHMSLGGANFWAALLIGILSIYFSRKQKMPVIIFHIPSLFLLVPGGPAYLAIRLFISGNTSAAFTQISIVTITAASIAGAFMMSNLVERIVLKISNLQKKHKNC